MFQVLVANCVWINVILLDDYIFEENSLLDKTRLFKFSETPNIS
jgi:hypothetical protein